MAGEEAGGTGYNGGLSPQDIRARMAQMYQLPGIISAYNEAGANNGWHGISTAPLAKAIEELKTTVGGYYDRTGGVAARNLAQSKQALENLVKKQESLTTGSNRTTAMAEAIAECGQIISDQEAGLAALRSDADLAIQAIMHVASIGIGQLQTDLDKLQESTDKLRGQLSEAQTAAEAWADGL